MDILVGGTGKMSYLYISTAGNAAAEARAGGADEETAQLYGMLSGSIKVAANQFKGIPGLDEYTINNWLMGMVQSNTGRAALKHLVKTLGKGTKDFVIKIAEAYFAKMWNGDERSFGQIAGETLPNAVYQELIGTLTNAMMNVSVNTI